MMNSDLMYRINQQHIAELHQEADMERLAHAAGSGTPNPARRALARLAGLLTKKSPRFPAPVGARAHGPI